MRHTPHLVIAALIIALFSSLSNGFAQTDAEPPFTLVDDQPVVTHSSNSGDWDGRYTDPGAVFYHDGQFHMFRNGFKGWPASVQIGYLTSEDGVTWTEMSEEPVLYTDDVAFAEVAALASSAFVEPDGTWVLYFYTWNTFSISEAEIGRATATDPLGPWTVDPEPVLSHGAVGEWDSAAVDTPSVIRTDDGYLMYYAGLSEGGRAIGVATSEDGITWTKGAEPVLTSQWEDYAAHQPRVERIEDGYVMFFRLAPLPTATALRGQMGLGIATSADGMNWTIETPESFWGRDSIPGARGFWFTATAYHDDTFYLYIEGGVGNNTDIFVATSTEHFPQ